MSARKSSMNDSASQKIKKEAFIFFLSLHLNHQNLQKDGLQISHLMPIKCIFLFNEANPCIFNKLRMKCFDQKVQSGCLWL